MVVIDLLDDAYRGLASAPYTFSTLGLRFSKRPSTPPELLCASGIYYLALEGFLLLRLSSKTISAAPRHALFRAYAHYDQLDDARRNAEEDRSEANLNIRC